MSDIRQAERRAAQATGEGEDGASVSQGEGVHRATMSWTQEATDALTGLAEGGKVGKLVILVSLPVGPREHAHSRLKHRGPQEIDMTAEQITLASEDTSSLRLPPSSPCYAFYQHAGGLGKTARQAGSIFLVYSCVEH